MKRHDYKGYIIDTDNLGRVYIYNTESPYSEDSDRQILGVGISFREAKEAVDIELKKRGLFEDYQRRGVSAAQNAAQARYDAENTVQVRLKLNKKTDADILDQLEKVENKQGYIKELIRRDIAGVK